MSHPPVNTEIVCYKTIMTQFKVAPCKVMQDSIRFWIPSCEFQMLDSGFYLYRFRIPKHKRFQILLSGLLLIFAFRLLGMTSMADFVIESFSITTFGNYKKYITANQGINFSSKNTY